MKNVLLVFFLLITIQSISFASKPLLTKIKLKDNYRAKPGLKADQLKYYSPRFAIKTEPLRLLTLYRINLSFERNINYQSSYEIELSLKPVRVAREMDFVRALREDCGMNVTLRYKRFVRNEFDDSVMKNYNFLEGAYYAPMLSFGQSRGFDWKEMRVDYYLAGMLDFGKHIMKENLIVDVYFGAGITLNTGDRDFVFNNSHFANQNLAFRIGYRIGFSMETRKLINVS